MVPTIKEYVTEHVRPEDLQFKLNGWLGQGYLLHSAVPLSRDLLLVIVFKV